MKVAVRFRADLFEKAEKILAERSLTDEVKAGRDIMIVENLLKNGAQSVFSFDSVNERLHEEYPAIMELESITGSIAIPTIKKDRMPELDSKENQLLLDKCGIYATLLVRHSVVHHARDVLQEYTA